jgi:YjjG family noncanonical pyrimidine nucleotidase
MSYQWLLFDADGTLFDYDTAEASALRNAFRIERLEFSAEIEAVYRQINKQVWQAFENGQISSQDLRVERFQQLFSQFKLNADPSAFSRLYLACLAQSSQLIDGAQELVFQLRAQGYHLAIVTNGIADVQRSRLAASALAGCFEGLFISEELGSAKPDPAFFEAVFQQLGHPEKSGVLVIGDSLSSDIRGGQAFQLDTCWYCPNPVNDLPGDLQPTYIINKLAEIHTILLGD